MRHVVITGASSGLGREIAEQLAMLAYPGEERFEIHNWSLDTGVDVTDARQVEAAAAKLSGHAVYALINCAGINHIDWMENLSEAQFDRVLDVNAKAIWRVSKALLPRLRRDRDGGTILNIVSNASHMPMTHSIAYNASKGAAHIMTLQMARELFPARNITVFGVSPNKLAGTGMSDYIDARVPELRGISADEAKAYQANRLPIGQETNVRTLAEFITFLLSTKERHRYLHGCVLPYGA